MPLQRKNVASYCTACGAQVKETDLYCPICGNRLEEYHEENNVTADVPVSSEKDIDRTPMARAISVLGDLMIIVSLFLPYISMSILGFGESFTFIEREDGPIIFVAAIIALIVVCTRFNFLSLLVTILLAGLCYFEYSSTMETLREAGIFAGVFDREAGFYLMAAGAVIMVFGAIMKFFEN